MPVGPGGRGKPKTELAGSGPRTTSPLRALLVIVPLLIIAGAGSNLLGLWSTSSQDTAREDRRKMAEREQARAPGQVSVSHPADGPETTARELPQEKAFSPDEIIRQIRDKLGALRLEDEEGGAPAPTIPTTMPPDRPAPSPDAAFDPTTVVARLSEASIDEGEQSFRMCLPCHPVKRGEPSRLGPNLWGVVGRPKAAAEDYRYSNSLAAVGGRWTYEELAAYLNSPKTFVPGTTMAFRGIADSARAASIIAYLRLQSDRPMPLPVGQATR